MFSDEFVNDLKIVSFLLTLFLFDLEVNMSNECLSGIVGSDTSGW